jgi:methylated-DNA-[protein]-cysteine S-methyltransferase
VKRTYCWKHPSPLGELLLASDGEALTGLYMEERQHGPGGEVSWITDRGPLREVLAQVDAYFAGERRTFSLPLAPEGSAFQLRVWRALEEIPYGETWSYRRLAEQVGMPGAARAVGSANARNPISLVVPCHRVIGSAGALIGYGGGLSRKRWLLDHEARA